MKNSILLGLSVIGLVTGIVAARNEYKKEQKKDWALKQMKEYNERV